MTLQSPGPAFQGNLDPLSRWGKQRSLFLSPLIYTGMTIVLLAPPRTKVTPELTPEPRINPHSFVGSPALLIFSFHLTEEIVRKKSGIFTKKLQNLFPPLKIGFAFFTSTFWCPPCASFLVGQADRMLQKCFTTEMKGLCITSSLLISTKIAGLSLPGAPPGHIKDSGASQHQLPMLENQLGAGTGTGQLLQFWHSLQ